jgi:fructosamine-3-kinase
MIFPSGNIITSGNILPNPPRSRSISDKYISWGNVLSENNMTESYNKFFNLFSTSYEKNFPLTKKVTKRKIDKNQLTQFDPPILISDVYDGKIKY